jgi:GNAT superfamily N-acetyltransferase
MPDITFKTATEHDIPVISQLADKIWRAHYPSIITVAQIEYMLPMMYSVDALQKQMAEGHEFTLAYIDDTPVAYASVSDKGAGSFFLHKFYVDTNIHGQGLGGKLFNYLVEKYKPIEFKLTVNRRNIKAINFYFKNDFVIQEAKDFDIGSGYSMDDFIMVRKG